MAANRKPRPRSASDQKVDVLACRHCHRDLVTIYQTTVGKLEFAVLPGVQCSIVNVLGQVASFRCPTCHHSTLTRVDVS